MDLEMTGLDPLEDRILEVAVIVTDWDLTELATYEAIVHVEPELIQRRMTGSFWDTYAHVRTALTEQNKAGNPARVVEDELLAFVSDWFEDDELVLLAGNSIHQDRKFIDNEWGRLAARLHYRMLDVSAWKVVFEGKYGSKFRKPETHRALADIRGSIEELGQYLQWLNVPEKGRSKPAAVETVDEQGAMQ
jgi:oligoribonuclease